MFNVGPPNTSCRCTLKSKPDSLTTACAALMTAFSPFSGIEPCAVTPRATAFSHKAPL
jgi:hypothetical protein